MENDRVDTLVRDNIKNLIPYSSAREEFTGKDGVFLNANENPFKFYGENRYPDSSNKLLRESYSKIVRLDSDLIMFGNGSDEIIDLIIRVFCEPAKDKILSFTPTYGIYKNYADINNIEYCEVELNDDLTLDLDRVIDNISKNSYKMFFLCSPNNPSGNLIEFEKIIKLIEHFKGLVILDEAYIEYSNQRSLSYLVENYSNLIVIQTLSKSWGLAGIRVGVCLSNRKIISYLNKIKPPYNISSSSVEIALNAFANRKLKENGIKYIICERERVKNSLNSISFVEKIFPSDSNFLLIRFTDSRSIFNTLLKNGIVVRDRSNLPKCNNSLRLTIGTIEENNRVIELLRELDNG